MRKKAEDKKIDESCSRPIDQRPILTYVYEHIVPKSQVGWMFLMIAVLIIWSWFK